MLKNLKRVNLRRPLVEFIISNMIEKDCLHGSIEDLTTFSNEII